MKRTKDTHHQAHFRTTRMFKQGESWYFNTRGGEVLGPFGTELEASNRLEAYIRMAEANLLPSSDLAISVESLSAESAS